MECKKCKKILPENYPNKYCEHCQNENIKNAKIAGATTLGILAAVGGILAIIVKKFGKRK